MKIYVNESEFEITGDDIYVKDLLEYKPGATIHIVNGGVVTSEYKLTDGDRLVLIKLGEIPSNEELAHVLMARHTPGVYEKLQKAKVGIAGLGGLGSNIAVALVRSGIGSLTGVDFDLVEPSNINRQQYFLDQIGMEKSRALESTLKRISPLTVLDLHTIKVTEHNAAEIFSDCDVLIEAFDVAYAKIMLYQTWRKQQFTSYYIGASGVAGYGKNEELKEKCMHNAYFIGDFNSEAGVGSGLMAPRVAVAAGMQANLAMKLILDEL